MLTALHGVLYEGSRTRVVRMDHALHGCVVVKQLRESWPGQAAVSRLKREYALLQRLDGCGAPRALDLELGEATRLVTEDTGGIELGRWLSEARRDARRALRVALALSRALDEVHQSGVLHRDVNPSNAIVNPETLETHLIDFDLASLIEITHIDRTPIGALSGTPPYMSPEQTGRTNARMDVRSDLYSLGATLYELFSGRPPFVCHDLLGYVHAHLALAPNPLDLTTVQDLPPALGRLVMTLLAKEPEKRYQSAKGVAHDLRRILEYVESGATGDLELEARELSDAPSLPDWLVGRDEERRRLLDAFEQARRGARGVVLVTGDGGVGKTSLVHELDTPVVLAGGLFLAGKFDQFTRDVPFAALSQVLEAFADEILSLPEERVAAWRARLIAACSPNAALLVDVCARWGALLGPVPPVAEISPNEGVRRLQDTVRRALGAMGSDGSALVLFLDDLQWADLPSLRVLEGLFADPRLSHLLLVGAYRDRELSGDHVLRPTLATIREAGARVERLELGPIAARDLEDLLSAGLRCADVAELARMLVTKAGGNPFFIRRLIDEATRGGVIHLSPDGVHWECDLDGFAALSDAENVLDLTTRELTRLSGTARTCVAAAAIIGSRFEASAVREVTGFEDEIVRDALRSAIHARHIRPLDLHYWDGGVRDGEEFRFAFVHDRIQEAAVGLHTPEERLSVHLAVARASSRDDDADLFAIAEHYARALPLVTEAEERHDVFRKTLAAGRRALFAAAHAPAHTFLETAIQVAGEGLWERDFDAARELYTLSARAAWLVGQFELLESRVSTLRIRARDVAEQLHAEEAIIQASIARGDLHGALDTALRVLDAAGTSLERHPTDEDVASAVRETLGVVGELTPDGLRQRVASESVELAARMLMVRIASAAYVAEPNLLPLIACELVRRTVTRGVSRESSYGFGVFSLCLSAGWLLEPAKIQGQTALALMKAMPDRVLEGSVRHVVNHFTRVWSEPLRRIYSENAEVYRALMNVGDLEYAGWVLHMRIVHGFFSGVTLDEMLEESEMAVASMELQRLDAALACTAPFRQLIAGLRGQSEDFGRLLGPDYDEVAAERALVDADFRGAVLAMAVARQVARLLANDLPGAAEATELVLAFADGAVAMSYQAPMRVYGGIAMLATRGLDAVEQALHWREPVLAFAMHNPAGGGHLLAMLDAEISVAKGELAEATRLFDEAIDAAASGAFLLDEGLANERAGRFHLERGARRVARIYLNEARFAYQRWGALAKADALDREFFELLTPHAVESPSGAIGSSSLPEDRAGGGLDFATMLKASQAIASEVTLDGLLSRSLTVLIENVGATRGALMLARRGGLRIEAIGQAGDGVRLMDGGPLEDEQVPVSLVRRVWRSGAPEVGHSGGGDQPTVSTLCAPITHRGRPLGVLYFENCLHADAFTSERLRVLDALAPQVAVSVRNIRLQRAQDRFVPYQFLRSLDSEDIMDVEAGDHRLREVSIFFSDIWGFTPLVEQLSAAEALSFVNRYLEHAEPEITGAGGFIDTYLGDGIMAIFDADRANAFQSVAAGVAVHRALERFNAQRNRDGLASVRTSIGINTGVVTLGIIGGRRFVKCGVVGDAVNLASRVEGLTRRTQSRLLISESTRAALPDDAPFTLRQAGRVRVKGRVQPLTVFEVLDAEPERAREQRMATRERYEEALAHFYAGRFGDARSAWREVIARVDDDPLSSRFLSLSERYVEAGVPPAWDGGIESLDGK